MRRRFEELEPREVLALAIAVEESNTARFQTLASLYEGYDESLLKLFQELRDEEIRHTTMLCDEWKRRFGDEPRPQICEADVEGVVEAVDVENGEHAIFDDLSREDALALVEKAEVSAQKFYEAAASQCTEPGLHALFLDLAAMEVGHVEALKEYDLDDESNRAQSG
jgi:rubrerythrin